MKATIYLHSGDKSEMHGEFVSLCQEHEIEPTSKAQQASCYVGYEVSIDGDWDSVTGEFTATHLMGSKLETPVKI
jgi:hypothetical protein